MLASHEAKTLTVDNGVSFMGIKISPKTPVSASILLTLTRHGKGGVMRTPMVCYDAIFRRAQSLVRSQDSS